MLFDTGTLGWYFTYGMSADGKYAYLIIIIFRVPSVGNRQIDSYDELTNSTIFNLGGYVLANGKKYPSHLLFAHAITLMIKKQYIYVIS